MEVIEDVRVTVSILKHCTVFLGTLQKYHGGREQRVCNQRCLRIHRREGAYIVWFWIYISRYIYSMSVCLLFLFLDWRVCWWYSVLFLPEGVDGGREKGVCVLCEGLWDTEIDDFSGSYDLFNRPSLAELFSKFLAMRRKFYVQFGNLFVCLFCPSKFHLCM